LRIINDFLKEKRRTYIISLLIALIFIIVMSNWIYVKEKTILGSALQEATMLFSNELTKNVSLTIDSFIVSDLELGDVEVNLHLVIKNNGNTSLENTNIFIPWDQIKGKQFPSIYDLFVDKEEVIVSKSVSEVLFSSNPLYLTPVKFKRINQNYIATGMLVNPTVKNSTFLHQFGNLISIQWKNPIENGAKEDISIQFKISGIEYREPNELEKIVKKILKAVPFNFYPFGGTFRIKLPLVFPFADEIKLTDLQVNLAFGYSAVDHKVTNYKLRELERELEPTSSSGFVLYKTTQYSEEDNCDKNAYEVTTLDNLQVPKELCVLNFPTPLFTKDILENSERWYLASDSPSRNKVHLMKFAFNPTLHPSYKDSPGIFLIVVDYTLKWWVLFIPFIFLFVIIIVAHSKFEDGHESTKIAILVSLLIGLLTYWGYNLRVSPQIHPNLLDISFMITTFIALFSIKKVSHLQKVRIFYPFIVSLIFLIIQFWSKGFGDLFLKLAIVFPVISFAVEFPSIAIILTSYPLLLLHRGNLTSSIFVLWIFRLLSLALFFDMIRKVIKDKIRIKSNFIKQFLSNYISFFIIWNSFTLFIFLIKKEIIFTTLLNYILLLPIGISLLLILQERLLKSNN